MEPNATRASTVIPLSEIPEVETLMRMLTKGVREICVSTYSGVPLEYEHVDTAGIKHIVEIPRGQHLYDTYDLRQWAGISKETLRCIGSRINDEMIDCKTLIAPAVSTKASWSESEHEWIAAKSGTTRIAGPRLFQLSGGTRNVWKDDVVTEDHHIRKNPTAERYKENPETIIVQKVGNYTHTLSIQHDEDPSRTPSLRSHGNPPRKVHYKLDRTIQLVVRPIPIVPTPRKLVKGKFVAEDPDVAQIVQPTPYRDRFSLHLFLSSRQPHDVAVRGKEEQGNVLKRKASS